MFDTPILFLFFNRKHVTLKVFDRIKAIKPKSLYLAADGPRINVQGESEQCEEVRNSILSLIDWDCEVKTFFRNHNLGCRAAVSGAIDWFFSHVDEGIILEDDCLPSLDFFPFCQNLLEYYRDDSRIMVISGDNFQNGRLRTENSYYFSKYTNIWGWATWKRAWNHWHYTPDDWNKMDRNNFIKLFSDSKEEEDYWALIYNNLFEKNVPDTWDYIWQFNCWCQNSLAINPSVNLVTNIGFGDGATNPSNLIVSIQSDKIKFPLCHPNFIFRDIEADRFFFKNYLLKSYHDLLDSLRAKRRSVIFKSFFKKLGINLK